MQDHVTAVCEAGRCWLCRGTVISLAYVGQCEHGCHGGDDLVVTAMLERSHDEQAAS